MPSIVGSGSTLLVVHAEPEYVRLPVLLLACMRGGTPTIHPPTAIAHRLSSTACGNHTGGTRTRSGGRGHTKSAEFVVHSQGRRLLSHPSPGTSQLVRRAVMNPFVPSERICCSLGPHLCLWLKPSGRVREGRVVFEKNPKG